MAPLTSRRDFILKSGKAGLGIYVGSTLLSSCSSAKVITGKNNTGFQQTPLAYSYNALNEAIDGTTMEIHYSKHAAGYAANLQAAAKNDGVDLIILDSDRSPQQSQASAKKSGNPFAVASFSSHNLGLAVDFKMSQGDQKFSETTTRPMTNIVNMMQSSPHKWLYQNGATYGWYPWNNEPWHWEYNPPDFRIKFYANCNCDPIP